MFISGLTPAARADLIEFCARHLNSGDFFAREWADKMIAEYDFSRSDAAHFEIPAHKTRSGNPETISFFGNELAYDAG